MTKDYYSYPYNNNIIIRVYYVMVKVNDWAMYMPDMVMTWGGGAASAYQLPQKCQVNFICLYS